MSNQQRFISRRGILATVGMTPAAVMAITSSADSRVAVQAAVGTAAATTDQGELFLRVCTNLWEAVVKAVLEVDSTMTIDQTVITKALELSQERILENIEKQSFPSDGKHYRTQVCAYVTGIRAANLAKADAVSEVSPDHYARAFDRTKLDIATIFAAIDTKAITKGLAC